MLRRPDDHAPFSIDAESCCLNIGYVLGKVEDSAAAQQN